MQIRVHFRSIPNVGEETSARPASDSTRFHLHLNCSNSMLSSPATRYAKLNNVKVYLCFYDPRFQTQRANQSLPSFVKVCKCHLKFFIFSTTLNVQFCAKIQCILSSLFQKLNIFFGKSMHEVMPCYIYELNNES